MEIPRLLTDRSLLREEPLSSLFCLRGLDRETKSRFSSWLPHALNELRANHRAVCVHAMMRVHSSLTLSQCKAAEDWITTAFAKFPGQLEQRPQPRKAEDCDFVVFLQFFWHISKSRDRDALLYLNQKRSERALVPFGATPSAHRKRTSAERPKASSFKSRLRAELTTGSTVAIPRDKSTTSTMPTLDGLHLVTRRSVAASQKPVITCRSSMDLSDQSLPLPSMDTTTGQASSRSSPLDAPVAIAQRTVQHVPITLNASSSGNEGNDLFPPPGSIVTGTAEQAPIKVTSRPVSNRMKYRNDKHTLNQLGRIPKIRGIPREHVAPGTVPYGSRNPNYSASPIPKHPEVSRKSIAPGTVGLGPWSPGQRILRPPQTMSVPLETHGIDQRFHKRPHPNEMLGAVAGNGSGIGHNLQQSFQAKRPRLTHEPTTNATAGSATMRHPLPPRPTWFNSPGQRMEPDSRIKKDPYEMSSTYESYEDKDIPDRRSGTVPAAWKPDSHSLRLSAAWDHPQATKHSQNPLNKPQGCSDSPANVNDLKNGHKVSGREIESLVVRAAGLEHAEKSQSFTAPNNQARQAPSCQRPKLPLYRIPPAWSEVIVIM